MMLNRTDLLDAIHDHFEQLNRDWNDINVDTYRNPYYHVLSTLLRNMTDEQLNEWLFVLKNTTKEIQ